MCVSELHMVWAKRGPVHETAGPKLEFFFGILLKTVSNAQFRLVGLRRVPCSDDMVYK